MINNKIIFITLNFLLISFSNQIFGQTTSKKEILWTVDWSPNGKYIAIGGNIDTLKIYNEDDLKLNKFFLIKNTITRIKWHPSMNIIAVTTQMSSEKSFILNLDTNEKIELNNISKDGARGLDWNYTGDYLGVADNDGQVLIYDSNGKLIRKFENQFNSTKGITALEWHPKKNILTTISDRICFFDSNGKLLNSIKHRPEEVMLLSIAWHKSGDFFVIGDYGDDKNKSFLQYWNEQGELLKTINISEAEYRNIAWNKKGTKLATASDALRIWDKKGNLISTGRSKDYLWGVSWNKKGNRIITSSLRQQIILWDNKTKIVEIKE